MKRFLLSQLPGESERSSNVVCGDVVRALNLLERTSTSSSEPSASGVCGSTSAKRHFATGGNSLRPKTRSFEPRSVLVEPLCFCSNPTQGCSNVGHGAIKNKWIVN